MLKSKYYREILKQFGIFIHISHQSFVMTHNS